MFSISVAWEGVTFIAGDKTKTQCRSEFISGTLIVSCIYIVLLHVCSSGAFCRKLQLQESDRVAVVASQYIFGSVGTLLMQ
jgi:APA family basic amino acid/polyamine antiporter